MLEKYQEKVVQMMISPTHHLFILTNRGNIFMRSPVAREQWRKVSLPNFSDEKINQNHESQAC